MTTGLFADRVDTRARLGALREYMASREYNDLPIAERQLIQRQASLLEHLARVLDLRQFP